MATYDTTVHLFYCQVLSVVESLRSKALDVAIGELEQVSKASHMGVPKVWIGNIFQ